MIDEKQAYEAMQAMGRGESCPLCALMWKPDGSFIHAPFCELNAYMADSTLAKSFDRDAKDAVLHGGIIIALVGPLIVEDDVRREDHVMMVCSKCRLGTWVGKDLIRMSLAGWDEHDQVPVVFCAGCMATVIVQACAAIITMADKDSPDNENCPGCGSAEHHLDDCPIDAWLQQFKRAVMLPQMLTLIREKSRELGFVTEINALTGVLIMETMEAIVGAATKGIQDR